jgi:hypothetical protein
VYLFDFFRKGTELKKEYPLSFENEKLKSENGFWFLMNFMQIQQIENNLIDISAIQNFGELDKF